MLNLTFGRDSDKGGVIISAEAYNGLVRRLEKIQRQIETIDEWNDILREEMDLAKTNENFELAAAISQKTISSKIEVVSGEVEDLINTLTAKRE